MMIEHWEYTQDSSFVTAKLLPFCREVVTWYDLHWPRANGKISMYPAYSGEQDRNLTNPTSDIGALIRLLRGLLALPTSLTSSADRTYWASVQSQLPALPVSNGRLRTAESLELGGETNNQNLFPIFPFKLYSNGLPDRQVGVDSYINRVGKWPTSGFQAWRHDATHAAYLGLADEARKQVVGALTKYSYRYQGFLAGSPDGEHSIEPLAIGKIGLQAMLVHALGDRIQVLNAWPQSWDVRFKLWASRQTSVEGTYSGGALSSLSVSPSARAGDVVVSPLAAGVTSGTNYALTNQAGGFCLDVGPSGGDGSAVTLTGYAGAGSQQWTVTTTTAGWYKLVNLRSGQAMAVQGASTTAGAAVVQSPYTTDTTNDEWQLLDVGNGTYQLLNRLSGLALQAAGAGAGATLTQQPASGSPAQQFQLMRPVTQTRYRLVVAGSGLAVSVPGGTGNGVPVVQAADQGRADQKWDVVATDGGWFKLTTPSSGRALVVQGASLSPAPVVQYDYTADGTTNDQWRFLSQRNGTYEIVNRRSGLLLTSPGATTGGQLTQAARTGSARQQFQLTVAG